MTVSSIRDVKRTLGRTNPSPRRGRDGGESPRLRCPFRPRAVEYDRHAHTISMSFRTDLMRGAFHWSGRAAR